MGVADDVQQQTARMACPLCGGPLHLERDSVLACERGHGLDGDRAELLAASRAVMALWMAIEALEGEAEMLRLLAGSGVGTEAADRADQAARDAKILRDLASAHLPATGGAQQDGGSKGDR